MAVVVVDQADQPVQLPSLVRLLIWYWVVEPVQVTGVIVARTLGALRVTAMIGEDGAVMVVVALAVADQGLVLSGLVAFTR